MTRTAREPKRVLVHYRLPSGVVTTLQKRAKRDRVSMTLIVETALRIFLDRPGYAARHYVAAKGGAR
jgi:hypothetical protein